MIYEPSLFNYIILTLIGAFAGFVDAIAGGGGMITVPALLSVGVPPHLALGTNKLQSCFGACTSTYRYTKSGLVDTKGIGEGIFVTFLGAALGTYLVQLTPTNFLDKGIPFVLLAVFLYTLFQKDLGQVKGDSKLSYRLFYLIFGLILGFYDGFIGPGTGNFWTIAFVALLGFDLKTATANTKVLNFTSNMVSLMIFLMMGNTLLLLGLIMGLGQIVGAYLGSHLVISKGTKFIRIFFLIVVAITILKLFSQAYF